MRRAPTLPSTRLYHGVLQQQTSAVREGRQGIHQSLGRRSNRARSPLSYLYKYGPDLQELRAGAIPRRDNGGELTWV